MTQPNIESFLTDPTPVPPIGRVIADLLTHMAGRLTQLMACEPHILQNEANRQYDILILNWRKECDEQSRTDRRDEPEPEKPARPDFDPLALLASAFSPSTHVPDSTTNYYNIQTTKPAPSPFEKFLRYQKSLTDQFIRLFNIFQNFQNKPSPVGAPADRNPSPPANAILQNKPKSDVDVHVDAPPSAPKTSKLQNELPPSASSLQSSPSFLQNEPTPTQNILRQATQNIPLPIPITF